MTDSGRIVFSTPWFSVEALPAREGAADQRPFYRLNNQDGVIIVPVTSDGRLVMVRQYRQARGRMSLELPAGYIDGDEAPADAARRELFEETGRSCGAITALGVGGGAIDRETSRIHLFAARDVAPAPEREPEQGISVVVLDRAGLMAAMRAGEIEQLAGLGAVMLAEWAGDLW